LKEKGGLSMTKLLAKLAEKYAKSTNTACFVWLAWHQPKMPASLVKKD
jgi:cyclic lactone autoinducer peptide